MKRTINAIAVFTALCVVLTTSCFAADSSTLHNSDSSQYIVTNFALTGLRGSALRKSLVLPQPNLELSLIEFPIIYLLQMTNR